MKSIGDMTGGELAAFVASHLAANGIEVVLSGGGSVSIYSNGKYVSLDLDLVNSRFARRREIANAMLAIGFHERARHFEHPETDFLIDFPPGPLAIGEEPVSEVDELRFSTGTLKIISPTDCVKDRLAWYYHSDDLQCLEQAVLVARANEVDLAAIERWSEREGKLTEYRLLHHRLAGTGKRPDDQ